MQTIPPHFTLFTSNIPFSANPIRVSEQEARFAFVNALSATKLFYSVEAPTRKQYKFSDKTAISAQTDLAIYCEAKSRICNVEFKAKGVSENRASCFPYDKDLKKLMWEPVPGLWFQVLKSIDNGSINKFLDVLYNGIHSVYTNSPEEIDSTRMSIHICVLEHGFSLHKTLYLNHQSALNQQMHIGLTVSQTELLSISNLNGWTLFP